MAKSLARAELQTLGIQLLLIQYCGPHLQVSYIIFEYIFFLTLDPLFQEDCEIIESNPIGTVDTEGTRESVCIKGACPYYKVD